VTLFLHRLAALYLRLRRKRPPLEDMISAWSGGRWDPRCYRAAAKKGPPAGDGAA
jgi:hypothetical protein